MDISLLILTVKMTLKIFSVFIMNLNLFNRNTLNFPWIMKHETNTI